MGVKVIVKGKECQIYGNGIDSYKYKKNLTINAKFRYSGRLILGLLINSPEPINVVGDKSLSKRDFRRVSDPLSKFGAKFKLKNKNYLPLKIYGSSKPLPIKYIENKGSAQCKFNNFCWHES